MQFANTLWECPYIWNLLAQINFKLMNLMQQIAEDPYLSFQQFSTKFSWFFIMCTCIEREKRIRKKEVSLYHNEIFSNKTKHSIIHFFLTLPRVHFPFFLPCCFFPFFSCVFSLPLYHFAQGKKKVSLRLRRNLNLGDWVKR